MYMFDLVSSVTANFYEGYNFFLLFPILAFVLVDFGTITTVTDIAYYYFFVNFINSISKILSLYAWHKFNHKVDNNHFGKRSMLIYGFILNALSYILFGLSYNVYTLFVAKFLIGLNLNIPMSRTLLIRYFDEYECTCITVGENEKSGLTIINSISWFSGAIVSCLLAIFIYGHNPNIVIFQEYPLLILSIVSLSIGILFAIILSLFKFRIGMLFASANEPYVLPPMLYHQTNKTVYEVLTDINYYPLIFACTMTTITSVICSLLYKLVLLNPSTNGEHEYTVFYFGLSLAIAHTVAAFVNIFIKPILNYCGIRELYGLCSFMILIALLSMSCVKFINTTSIGAYVTLTIIYTVFQVSISIIYNMLYSLLYTVKSDNPLHTNSVIGMVYGITDIITMILDASLSLIFVLLFNYVYVYRLEYSIGLIIVFILNSILYLFSMYFVIKHKIF